jgi:hypothetical protein
MGEQVVRRTTSQKCGVLAYINTASERVCGDIDKCSGMNEIKELLKNQLLSFWDVHISRWSVYPEYERPSVASLIGVSVKDGPYDLFHYTGTAFHATNHIAIGSGTILANSQHWVCP